MQSAHSASVAVKDSSSDFFAVPPTNKQYNSYRIRDVNPTRVSINPVEFQIAPSVDYIDLSRSLFSFKIKFKDTIGANLDAAKNFFPAPNLLRTMIKQPRIWINGVLITEQTDSNAYKAYIETILNYSQDDTKTFLKSSQVTANNLDIAANNGLGHDNRQGLSSEAHKAVRTGLALTEEYGGGKEYILTGRFFVNIKIKLDLNNPSFFMIAQGKTARLTQDDLTVTFHMCHVKVRTDYYNTVVQDRLKIEKWSCTPQSVQKSECSPSRLVNGYLQKSHSQSCGCRYAPFTGLS